MSRDSRSVGDGGLRGRGSRERDERDEGRGAQQIKELGSHGGLSTVGFSWVEGLQGDFGGACAAHYAIVNDRAWQPERRVVVGELQIARGPGVQRLPVERVHDLPAVKPCDEE